MAIDEVKLKKCFRCPVCFTSMENCRAKEEHELDYVLYWHVYSKILKKVKE